MKHVLALVLVAAAAVAAAPPAVAGDVNLNVYPFSPRSLDKEYWEPIEDQYAFGGTVDFGGKGWPLHFAAGLHTSAGDDSFSNPFVSEARATISELSLGVAKVWTTDGPTRPFLSGGFSFVQVNAETQTFLGDFDDDDDGVGLWIEAGIYWRLGPHFNLGFYGRYLGRTDITLFGVDGDADYTQFGPVIGWSWPASR